MRPSTVLLLMSALSAATPLPSFPASVQVYPPNRADNDNERTFATSGLHHASGPAYRSLPSSIQSSFRDQLIDASRSLLPGRRPTLGRGENAPSNVLRMSNNKLHETQVYPPVIEFWMKSNEEVDIAQVYPFTGITFFPFAGLDKAGHHAIHDDFEKKRVYYSVVPMFVSAAELDKADHLGRNEQKAKAQVYPFTGITFIPFAELDKAVDYATKDQYERARD